MPDEETENLGLPLTEASRGGDANDVAELSETVNEILEFIDSGTGDYVVRLGQGSFTNEEGATPSTDFSFTFADMGFAFAQVTTPVTYPTESEFATANEDGSIEIIEPGTYSTLTLIGFVTDATEGDMYFRIAGYSIPQYGAAKVDFPGGNVSSVGKVAAFGADAFSAVWLHNPAVFMPAGTILVPTVDLEDVNGTVTFGLVTTALERT